MNEVHYRFNWKKCSMMGIHSGKTQKIGAMASKLLPKLHGSLNRLGPVLDALIGKVSKVKPQDNDPDAEPEVEKLYPLSHEKLTRMKDRVEKNGFTSFAEA